MSMIIPGMTFFYRFVHIFRFFPPIKIQNTRCRKGSGYGIYLYFSTDSKTILSIWGIFCSISFARAIWQRVRTML